MFGETVRSLFASRSARAVSPRRCYLAKGDTLAAQHALNQALAAGMDTYDVHISLAHAAQERHLYDEAVGHWERAIQTAQANPPPGADMAFLTSMLLNDLGVSHFLAGRRELAEQIQQRASELCPANPYPLLNCAIAAGRRGDVGRMRALLDRSLSVAPMSDIHLVQCTVTHALADPHGDVMLDALRTHRRVSAVEHQSHLATWRTHVERGQANVLNQVYVNPTIGVAAGGGVSIAGEGGLRMSEESINVSHSVVGGVSSGGGSVSDVRVYSSGNIQHAESGALAARLTELSQAIMSSDLPDPVKRSAQFELDAVVETLESPDSEDRRTGIAFHFRRVIDAVKGNEPLISAASGVAALLGIAS